MVVSVSVSVLSGYAGYVSIAVINCLSMSKTTYRRKRLIRAMIPEVEEPSLLWVENMATGRQASRWN